MRLVAGDIYLLPGLFTAETMKVDTLHGNIVKIISVATGHRWWTGERSFSADRFLNRRVTR
jgi:hypothetical protein